MDSAILDVRRSFELRMSELELLETKLCKVLRAKFPERDSPSSPGALFERLRSISKELPLLHDQVQKVDAEKEELVLALNRLTASNSSVLRKLQAKCHVVAPDSNDPQEHLSDPTLPPISWPTDTLEEAGKEVAAVPAEFGVSEEVFEGISKTIRGRTPLHDVNSLYGAIFSYFEQDPKSPPLTIPKLATLGAKAAGLKAQNAINTLRILKLIEVTKSGISLPKMQSKKRKSRAYRLSGNVSYQKQTDILPAQP